MCRYKLKLIYISTCFFFVFIYETSLCSSGVVFFLFSFYYFFPFSFFLFFFVFFFSFSLLPFNFSINSYTL
ncbi:hypothetical protein HanRHA438_Chr01g0026031 [Helianthus annuus]|nr:hypothetical protein HanRHA438_Chr01g0026031 [Helianthus annuus]